MVTTGINLATGGMMLFGSLTGVFSIAQVAIGPADFNGAGPIAICGFLAFVSMGLLYFFMRQALPVIMENTKTVATSSARVASLCEKLDRRIVCPMVETDIERLKHEADTIILKAKDDARVIVHDAESTAFKLEHQKP